jgi:hypothetical protein
MPFGRIGIDRMIGRPRTVLLLIAVGRQLAPLDDWLVAGPRRQMPGVLESERPSSASHHPHVGRHLHDRGRLIGCWTRPWANQRLSRGQSRRYIATRNGFSDHPLRPPYRVPHAATTGPGIIGHNRRAEHDDQDHVGQRGRRSRDRDDLQCAPPSRSRLQLLSTGVAYLCAGETNSGCTGKWSRRRAG